jgi:hypothetical protein
MDTFDSRAKLDFGNCRTGNIIKIVIFANGMDLGKCANELVKTYKLVY